jgi:hypothetical protein
MLQALSAMTTVRGTMSIARWRLPVNSANRPSSAKNSK